MHRGLSLVPHWNEHPIALAIYIFVCQIAVFFAAVAELDEYILRNTQGI